MVDERTEIADCDSELLIEQKKMATAIDCINHWCRITVYFVH